MLKQHLAGGVKKGAFTEEEAEKKFQAWLDEKAAKVDAKKDGLAKAKIEAETKALEADKAVNEARTAVPVEDEVVAEETTTEDVVVKEDTTETASEETKTEEAVEKVKASNEEE
jgi:small subunit ribosomal protein S16